MTDQRPAWPASGQDATFYAVSNARYFPALVALLNSLRLTGHRDELVVGDCGLTPSQRDLLRPHCTLFEIPRDRAIDPVLFKAFPRLLNPTGTLVIIDGDMIVTGSLEPSVTLAKQGKICAYPDPEHDRRYREWEQLFDLPSAPRRQTYVSSHFVTFSTSHWPRLLEQWWRACERIPARGTRAEGAPEDDPFAQGDQDALNALLMSEVPAAALALLPDGERPVQRNLWVKVVEDRSLACTYRGRPTKLLHADGRRKPWEPRAWWKVRRDAYVRLLRRLLHGPDVTLTVPPEELPIWLRPGVLGELSIRGLDILNATSTPLIRGSRPIRLFGRGMISRRREYPRSSRQLEEGDSRGQR